MIHAVAAIALAGSTRVVLPPALARPAAACRQVASIPDSLGAPVIVFVRLESSRAGLYALALLANFEMPIPHGDEFQGALFYQLDDQAPTLSGIGTGGHPVNWLDLRFGGVALGHHRVSVGLVSAQGKVISYQQLCFAIRDEALTTYDVRRPAFIPPKR